MISKVIAYAKKALPTLAIGVVAAGVFMYLYNKNEKVRKIVGGA
jgi:uncharacterized membrane protein YraQ (UPF0718 family)